jgi:hypothetical protein
MPRNYQRKTNDVTMSWAFRQLPFWERVKAQTIINENGCHIFTGSKDDCGYGRISKDGKLTRVHRAVYEKVHGKIANKMVIMHSCDNPACINIHHLSADYQSENIKDMYSKGRGINLAGSKHGMSKIKEADVIEIKKRLSDGDTCVSISKDYGVSEGTIRNIKKGRNWKHVT